MSHVYLVKYLIDKCDYIFVLRVVIFGDKKEIEFNFDIEDIVFEIKGLECKGCAN